MHPGGTTGTDRGTAAFSPVPSWRKSPRNWHHPRRCRFASACWSSLRSPPEGRGVRGVKDQAVGPGARNGMAAVASALGWIVQHYCGAGRKPVVSRRAFTARNGRMRTAGADMAVGLVTRWISVPGAAGRDRRRGRGLVHRRRRHPLLSGGKRPDGCSRRVFRGRGRLRAPASAQSR